MSDQEKLQGVMEAYLHAKKHDLPSAKWVRVDLNLPHTATDDEVSAAFVVAQKKGCDLGLWKNCIDDFEPYGGYVSQMNKQGSNYVLPLNEKDL